MLRLVPRAVSSRRAWGLLLNINSSKPGERMLILNLHSIAPSASLQSCSRLFSPRLGTVSHNLLQSQVQRGSRCFAAISSVTEPPSVAKKEDSDPRSNGPSTSIKGLSESSQGSRPKKSRTMSKDKRIEANLKSISGVGPRNAQLLASAGCESVDHVMAIFKDQCRLDPEKFREHLKDKIGIKAANHISQIVAYCQNKHNGDAGSYATLSVEGNISAGKSTFLDGISNFCPDLRDLLHVAPEPVAKWQNVDGKGNNILDMFYIDKKRYAYTFQNYIFITRFMQEQQSAGEMHGQPYRLLERSVWCDRMVFVESLKASNLLTDMELALYHAWFDPMVKQTPTLVPDGFIYLKAQPETCLERLKIRQRDEENAVELSYLEDLHGRHEDWLNGGPWEASQVQKRLETMFSQGREAGLDLSGREVALAATNAAFSALAPKIPSLIANDIRMMKQNKNLPDAINGLPALVLDCNKDIRDIDAQKEHANKVNEYFKYVKEVRFHKLQQKEFEKAHDLDQEWKKAMRERRLDSSLHDHYQRELSRRLSEISERQYTGSQYALL